MIRGLTRLAFAVVLMGGVPADMGAAEDRTAVWFAPTHVTVTAGAPPSRDMSRVEIMFAEGGDLEVRLSGLAQGQPLRGEFLVIGGRIMLAKDADLPQGMEIDALDGPVLQVQLVLRLLARALPEGPQSVRERQPLSITETSEPLEVATPSASGSFSPPWSVTGHVAPGAAKRLEFRLIFTFAEQEQPLTLTGTWQRLATPPVIEDTRSVADRRSFTIGPYSRSTGGSTILDYGAQPLNLQFKTVADVRKHVGSPSRFSFEPQH